MQFARESYISDLISLRLDQDLGTSGKWKAYLGGTLEHQSYEIRPGQTRARDEIWVRGGGGVSCQFTQWMVGSLGYEYENYASNFAVGGFVLQIRGRRKQPKRAGRISLQALKSGALTYHRSSFWNGKRSFLRPWLALI